VVSVFEGTRQVRTAAPPATPPRYGLLFAATDLTGSLDGRWPNGLKWSPETTLGGGVIGIGCTGNTEAMSAGTNPAVTTADPFVVWAEDHCTTAGWQTRDFEGRARRQLEATQSFRIANELWLGTEAQASNLDNGWLTDDPKILTGAAAAPMEALALVDIGLGQMLGGRRGMIHVSPQTLTELATNEAIQMSGQLWLTAMGNIVVSDAGYPGTGPDGNGGGKQWIYGTPLVGYGLGPIEAPNFGDPRVIAQFTNRDVNLTTFYASREAILLWDWKTPIGSSGKTGKVAAETTTAAFAAL
jgi:hypothetical protein